MKKLRISRTKKERHGTKIAALREEIEKVLTQNRMLMKARLKREGEPDPDQMSDVLIREAMGTIDWDKVALKLKKSGGKNE